MITYWYLVFQMIFTCQTLLDSLKFFIFFNWPHIWWVVLKPRIFVFLFTEQLTEWDFSVVAQLLSKQRNGQNYWMQRSKIYPCLTVSCWEANIPSPNTSTQLKLNLPFHVVKSAKQIIYLGDLYFCKMHVLTLLD